MQYQNELERTGTRVTILSVTKLRPFYFARGIGVRQVRLVCGLILFGYLLSHYIDHSLGNISLDAMEYGLWVHATF